MVLGALSKFQAGSIEVIGKEHLDEIPDGMNVVVAGSHVSDFDMPLIATALGKDLNIAITDMSVHSTDWKKDPTYVGMLIAGIRNFIQISWHTGAGGKRQPRLNPENYGPVRDALNRGKAVLMAAHNPSYGSLPDKPGIGAELVAETTPNTVILPVTVDVQDEQASTATKFRQQMMSLFRRPKVVVTIGKPITPQMQIDPADLIRGETRSAAEVSQTLHGIRDRSRVVMQALAEMLPEGQKGSYGKKKQE